jgi:hypothetical protein
MASEWPANAVITAQIAVEVCVQSCFDVLLRLEVDSDKVWAALVDCVPDASFMERKTRTLWEALTDEGAVGARPVVNAVEVHRVRAHVERVEVLEVHTQPIARACAQQRAGDQVLVARSRRLVRQGGGPSAACSGGRRLSGTPSATGSARRRGSRRARWAPCSTSARERPPPSTRERPRTQRGRRPKPPPPLPQ